MKRTQPLSRPPRAALAACLWLAAAVASHAQVTNVVQEDFTGNNVGNSWIAQGGACLTAGDANTRAISNGIGIPACVGDKYYYALKQGGTNPTNTGSQLPLVGLGATADPIGSGALRLTNGGAQSTNESGAIISATPYPANQGIQVTFTTYTYGGNAYDNGNALSGADGIAFYLMNAGPPADGSSYGTLGSKYPFYQIWNSRAASIGAFGGSLGYSCANGKNPSDGMPGGYLGLGIDEFGNYLNSRDNTGTGIDAFLGLRTWPNNGRNPGEIALRGYGAVDLAALRVINPNATNSDVQAVCANGGSYSYQGKTYRIPDYAGIFTNPGTGAAAYTILPSSQPLWSQESDPGATRTKATPITYKLIISPGGQLSFYYDYGNRTDAAGNLQFAQVIDQLDISQSNGPLPSQFYFGFGASTGGGTNVHEISCFEASPAARAIGAPVAPAVVSSGQYLYTLSTNPSPLQGYVYAYALSASGTTTGTPAWEAGSLMKATRSAILLQSTAANGSSVVSLGRLDSAAFALGSNPCVPDVATIVAYTVDPSSVTAPANCPSYLGSRATGALLDGFSAGDAAALLQPPGNPADIGQPGYLAFARAQAARPAQLLFTNDDGFVYGVDASSGALRWAWMPRSFVSQLQNYGSWPYQQNFAGNFSAIDASSAATSGTTRNWATYVVGSAQGGALWWDVQLDAQGRPASVVKTLQAQVGTGRPPANTAWLPAGAYFPQRQAPVSASVGNSQYAAFVVNDASGASSLVEFDVATGAPTASAALYASLTSAIGRDRVTSNLYLDPANGELVFGTASGDIYVTSFSGNAAVDAANATLIGVVHDSGNAVRFVGSQTVGHLPYLWATTTAAPAATKAAGITVFGIGSNGFTPIWASSPGSAYVYGGSSWTPAGSKVAAMQQGALISDAPRVVNGTLVVPVYVPPPTSASACNVNGTGYYDFFTLASGLFPRNAISYGGQLLGGNLSLGQGSAYMPNLAVDGSSVAVFGGTQQSSSPVSPLLFPIAALNAVTQWRVH